MDSVDFSTFSVSKNVPQSELFFVLDGVQNPFQAIAARTDHIWKFRFSIILTEDCISLGLGSVNFSTFSVSKNVPQSELFSVLDGVQNHFQAIAAPTDHIWKFWFSIIFTEHGI